MKKLDDVMLSHIKYIVLQEKRPFSYLDFRSFEVAGQVYNIKHGTFRNKISELIRNRVAELDYRSNVSFYTLKGVNFGKKKDTMTLSVTPHYMGVYHVTNASDVMTKTPLYMFIQNLQPDRRALHDIHLKFQVPDIWTILASSKKYIPNDVSKAIALPCIITSNHLKMHTFVHKTDTVTVSVACSFAPIATDTDGLIRLSNALTRVEERTSRILDECGNMLPVGYESIPIPEHVRWTVTLWHFGTDSQNYAEDNSCITWHDGQNILGRVYSKQKHRKRSEIQERPNKPYADAIRDKTQDLTIKHEADDIATLV
jgi:hypothetical protein